nr:C-type isolectin Sp-CL4-like [Nerophis lumbriciformis]
MPSAVTTVLLMLALMVASASAQSLNREDMTALCHNIQLQPCDGGEYRLNDDSCVKMLPSQLIFTDARRGCQMIGGDVVTVKNGEELHKLLCMMFKALPVRLHYWIGAERGPGGFHWIDGSGPLESSPWREGQPDNFHHKENCVWMNSGSWGPWNDGSCSVFNSVACQIPK